MTRSPRLHLRRVLKPLAIIAGVLTSYIGVVGFAHTPKGRPLLPYLGLQYFGGASAAMCPVNGKDPSPERFESQRVSAMNTMRGHGLAPSSEAFGFVLDVANKAQVQAWAADKHVQCKSLVSDQALDCANVLVSSLPLTPDSQTAHNVTSANRDAAIESIFFRFRPDGILVGVDAMLTDASGTGAVAAAHFDVASRELQHKLGAPLSPLNAQSPSEYAAALLGRPYSQRDIVYRYENLAVDVRLLSLDSSRLIWRAQYRSVPRA